MVDLENTRWCALCGVRKPLSEFHKCSRTGDARRNTCKACDAERFKLYRIANPQRFRMRAQKYAVQRRVKKLQAERQAEIKRKQREKVRIEAKQIMNAAIARKELERKLCEVCAKNGRVSFAQGHHSDYRKPKDILWLCALHHRNWHRLFLTEDTDE